MNTPESNDFSLACDVFLEGNALCLDSAIGCQDYHYVRPILRIIEAVSSPYHHQSFYEDSLSEVTASLEKPVITISGTADYAWMLSKSPLIRALGNKATEAEICVSDACKTPLLSSQKAASLIGIEPIVFKTDIRSNLVEDQDLIITDAFLTQFPEPLDRLSILKTWRQSLKVGGFVISTVMLKNHDVQPSKNALKTFVENSISLYEQSNFPNNWDVSTEIFTNAIRNYASPSRSRIYDTEAELVNQIEESGLKIVDMQTKKIYSSPNEKIHNYRQLMLTRVD